MPMTKQGIWFPESGDHTRIWELLEKLADSLEGRMIVPVAHELDRDALATMFQPTPEKPLYVHRANAPETVRLEWTDDGATWHEVATGSTGWETLSFANSNLYEYPGFGRVPSIKREGNTIKLRGTVRRKGGNLAAGHRPFFLASLADRFPLPTGLTYNTGVASGSASVNWAVYSDGNVEIRGIQGSTDWAALDGLEWDVPR